MVSDGMGQSVCVGGGGHGRMAFPVVGVEFIPYTYRGETGTGTEPNSVVFCSGYFQKKSALLCPCFSSTRAFHHQRKFIRQQNGGMGGRTLGPMHVQGGVQGGGGCFLRVFWATGGLGNQRRAGGERPLRGWFAQGGFC